MNLVDIAALLVQQQIVICPDFCGQFVLENALWALRIRVLGMSRTLVCG